MKLKIPFLEGLIWIAALVTPFFIDPFDQTATSLCLFHAIGITWCPGCGLGRSIALLYSGELGLSLKMHPLGLPAVMILMHRIYIIFKPLLLKQPHEYKTHDDASGITTG